MKIALLISSLGGGGAERVVCNLANYLYENGHDVDVITMSNKNDTYKLSNGVNRVNLLNKEERTNRLHNLYIEQKKLKQYLFENQDVSCYIAMLPINVFLLTRMRKRIKGKIIISERANPTSYKRIYRVMMRYAIKRCDGLVVQTKDISKYYKNVKEKIIIPNAINKDIIFPNRDNIEKRIVAVGRLRSQKNYPMMIKAFALFDEKKPGYILEIYGQGSDENKLKEIVKRYDLEKKIKFMGYVSNISERIANASCFVMTSNHEGISNALIEAMCIGLPCVATDCDGGGARELIENNKNGILVKKNDANTMASKMLKVIEDERFSRRISSEAKKMRQKLNGEKIYNEWMEYITKIEGKKD